MKTITLIEHVGEFRVLYEDERLSFNYSDDYTSLIVRFYDSLWSPYEHEGQKLNFIFAILVKRNF